MDDNAEPVSVLGITGITITRDPDTVPEDPDYTVSIIGPEGKVVEVLRTHDLDAQRPGASVTAAVMRRKLTEPTPDMLEAWLEESAREHAEGSPSARYLRAAASLIHSLRKDVSVANARTPRVPPAVGGFIKGINAYEWKPGDARPRLGSREPSIQMHTTTAAPPMEVIPPLLPYLGRITGQSAANGQGMRKTIISVHVPEADARNWRVRGWVGVALAAGPSDPAETLSEASDPGRAGVARAFCPRSDECTFEPGHSVSCRRPDGSIIILRRGKGKPKPVFVEEGSDLDEDDF